MWIAAAIAEYYLVFLELWCFSPMLPSMPNEEIFSMNVDGIPLEEYPEHWRVLTCCIHDCVYHWCQHSSKFVKIGRVADRNYSCMDKVFIF